MRTHFNAHHLHSVHQTALLVEIPGDHVPAQKGFDECWVLMIYMIATLRMSIQRDDVHSNYDADDMTFEDVKKVMKTVQMLKRGMTHEGCDMRWITWRPLSILTPLAARLEYVNIAKIRRCRGLDPYN